MKILAIIPARGGSKGIPRKNIKKIEGKPLIEYTIDTAKKCEQLFDVVVSTEDEEIETIAKANHCKVIKRPKELATDHSKVQDACLHILKHFEEKDILFDAILLLQPTSPLRTVADIDNVIELMVKNDVDGIVSVCEVEDMHPARMYTNDNNGLISIMPDFESTRRQNLPKYYVRNGCIYLTKVEALVKEKSFMPANKMGYIMDSNWAVNIDQPKDFELLKVMMKTWKKR